MRSAWHNLWVLVVEGTPTDEQLPAIHLDPDNAGEVLLVWPDGSRSCWWLDDRGQWHPYESLHTAAGDVAARDTL